MVTNSSWSDMHLGVCKKCCEELGGRRHEGQTAVVMRHGFCVWCEFEEPVSKPSSWLWPLEVVSDIHEKYEIFEKQREEGKDG